MPYKSTAQEHFFEGCRHNPRHMKGRCPDEKMLSEFHNAEKTLKAKRALRA